VVFKETTSTIHHHHHHYIKNKKKMVKILIESILENHSAVNLFVIMVVIICLKYIKIIIFLFLKNLFLK